MKRKQAGVWLLIFLFILQSFSLSSLSTLRAENMGQIAFGDVTAQHDVAASEGAGDYVVNWTFTNTASAAPETPQSSQDIVLVVDRSRVWNGEAEAALNSYMSQVLAQGNTRLGLVTYGLEVFDEDSHTINVDGVESVYNEPQGVQSLTTDLTSLQNTLNNSSEAAGGVPEPLRGRFSQDALQEAAKMLESSSDGKIVVIARGLPNYSYMANTIAVNDDAPYAVDNNQQQYASLPTGFSETVIGNGMAFYFRAEDPALGGQDYYEVHDGSGAAPSIILRDHATALQGEAFKIRKNNIDVSVIGYDLSSYSGDSGLGVEMIENTLRGMVSDSADFQSAQDTSGLTNALNATIPQAATAGSEPVTLSFFDVLSDGVSLAEGVSPSLSSSSIPQETLAGLALASDGKEVHLSGFSLAAGQDVRLSYEISIDPAVTGGNDVYVSVSSGLSSATGDSVAFDPVLVASPEPPAPSTGSVAVYFYDEQGNPIANAEGNTATTILADVPLDTHYNVSAPDIPGYQFVGPSSSSAPLEGSVVAGTTEVYLVYQPTPRVGSVVAHFVDASGNPISNNEGQSSISVLADAALETYYQISAPEITGYNFVGLAEGSAPNEGSVVEGTTDIYFVYELAPQTGSVVAYFFDTQGNSLADASGSTYMTVLADAAIDTAYQVTAPEITGYRYVGLTDNSAPDSGAVVAGTTEVYLAYEVVPQTGTVVANFIDTAGNAINNNDGNSSVTVIADAEVGTQYAFEALSIDGYDFVGVQEGTPDLMGTVAEGTTNLYLVYQLAPQTGTVVANFVDTEGNAINNNDGNSSVTVIADAEVGTQYAFEALSIDGYDFVGVQEGTPDLMGTVAEGTTNLYLVYQLAPQTGSVVANFVDTEGNAINNNDGNSSVTVIADAEVGTQYAFEALSIDGYDFVGVQEGTPDLMGTVVEGTTNLYLVYQLAPQTGTVVANFVDTEGNAINNNDGNSSVTVIADAEVGTQYAFEAPSINGYTYIGVQEGTPELSGSVVEGTTNLYLVYEEDPTIGTVVANFVDTEGNAINNNDGNSSVTVIADAEVGTQYAFEAPSINGYTYIGVQEGTPELSGSVVEGTTNLYLVYEEDPTIGTVVANFVDTEGNAINNNDGNSSVTVIADAEVGTQYAFEALSIDGYDFVGVQEGTPELSGTVAEGTTNLYLVYQLAPQTGTVVANFVDTEGNAINNNDGNSSVTVIADAEVGTQYAFEALSIDGYDFVGVQEGTPDLTGSVVEGTTNLYLVYQLAPQTGTVVANFVDTEGNAINNNDGNSSVTVIADAEVGTQYAFEALSIDGYDFVGVQEGTPDLMGTVVEGTTNLYLVYQLAPQTGTVVANFVDTEGNAINNNDGNSSVTVIADAEVGTQYAFEALSINGYDFVGVQEGTPDLMGTVAEGTTNLYLVYQLAPQTGTVVANFVDTEGNAINNNDGNSSVTVIADAEVGTQYAFEAPSIDGYDFVGVQEGTPELSGSVAEGTTNLYLVYEEDPTIGTVVANFVDTEGNAINNNDGNSSVTVIADAEVGTQYAFEAPSIDGYDFVGVQEGTPDLMGTVAEGTTNLYLVYQLAPQTGTVVANFVDTEGNAINNNDGNSSVTVIADAEVGTQYAFEALSIDGYDFVGVQEGTPDLMGTVAEGTTNLYLVYQLAPQTGTVVANFVDTEGNAINNNDGNSSVTVIADAEVGTQYAFEALSIDGYDFVGVQEGTPDLMGTVAEGTTNLYLVYQLAPQTGTVVANFVDTEGNAINNNDGNSSVTVIADAEVGTQYAFEALSINGYTYIGVQEGTPELSGSVVEGTTNLYLVYEEDPTIGTVVANFVDTEGNAINNNDGNSSVTVIADAEVGTQYAFEALSIDGYDFIGVQEGTPDLMGTVAEGTTNLYLVYEEDPTIGTVVARFVDTEGTSIREQQTVAEGEVGTSYTFETPGIDGYTFAQLADDSAPTSGVIVEGEQIIILVYEVVPDTGTVVARFVDGDGRELSEQQTVAEGDVGTDYSIQAPEITDYRYVGLAEGSAPLTGPITEGEQIITLVYEAVPKTGTVLARFVDTEGNPIREQVTVAEGEEGTAYTFEAPEIDGYTYARLAERSMELSGEVPEGELVITLVYEKDPETGTVVARYLDASGNSIREEETVASGNVGTDYVHQAPSIENYRYDSLGEGSAALTGKIAEDRQVITLIYVKKTGTVVAQYVDVNGNTIAEQEDVAQGDVGTAYSFDAKRIEGYVYVGIADDSADLRGEITEGEKVIIFEYEEEPDTGSILVRYEDTAGNPIRDEEITVEDGTVGSAYTVEPPRIEGYTYRYPKTGSRPVSGEIQPGENIVTLVYESDGEEEPPEAKVGRIILRYEDTAGASIHEEQIYREDIPVGEEYEVTQPEIDGYNFKYLKNGSRPAKGTVIEGDNIVTFVYEPAEEPKFANLILRFEDEEGLQIQAATTLLTDQIEGTQYKVEVPEIDGFEFLHLKNGSAPLEGTFREGDNIITAVYKKIEAAELGSVYVRYFDESGEEIRDADALVYEAEYGTAYQAVPPVIENYEYVGLRNGSAPVEGVINSEAITVSFVYKRAAQIGSVQVSFLDPQQNKIREDLITHKDQPVGSSYAVQLPHVAGYTFSSLQQGSAPLTGTIQEGVTAITAIYQKEAQSERGGLVLHYRDDQGNTIKDSQRLLQNARVGTPYLVTIPAIQGYTFQGMAPGSAPTRGTLKEGENVLTFLYKKNVTGADEAAQRGSVIVHYVDEMGRPIIEDVILLKDVRVGTRYTAQAPVINGYEYLRVKVGGAPPEGQVKEGDQHVTFVYRQSGTAASGNAPVVATGESLSPVLWVGIALLVLAVALFVVRIVLKKREDRQFEEATLGRHAGDSGNPYHTPVGSDEYPEGSIEGYTDDPSNDYLDESSDDYTDDPAEGTTEDPSGDDPFGNDPEDPSDL